MKSVSAATVVKAFVIHWMCNYGPSIWILSENGTQCTSRFSQNTSRILGVENDFTKTYHPQEDGKMEPLNREILQSLSN